MKIVAEIVLSVEDDKGETVASIFSIEDVEFEEGEGSHTLTIGALISALQLSFRTLTENTVKQMSSRLKAN